MRRPPIAARVGLPGASLLLAASCGSGDDEPDVEVDAGRSITRTDCTDLWIEASNARTEKDSSFVRYELENGDTVISTLQGPRVGRIAVDDTFDEVDAAIDTCVAQDLGTAEVERLDGLPEGAVGFRETQDDSGEPEVTERTYGRVDDEHAAVVTVVHEGTGAPATSAADLLPRALERASG